MLTGLALIGDVNGFAGSDKQMGIWWLGQHSFIVKVAGKVLYIDPFLTPLPERCVPPLLKAQEIMNADFILGTHDHLDHIDRAQWAPMAAASPKAQFVIPEFHLPKIPGLTKVSPERFVTLDDGKSVMLGEVKISAIAAAHEFLEQDPATGRYPYLGYIIEAGGFTIYHAGDTCIYEGMITKLKKWSKIDVAFLPINGRDAYRFTHGIIGNMTYQEAVDLAGAITPAAAVPTHYEMFTMNQEDPRNFVQYANAKFPKLATHICAHGERWVVNKQ